MILIADSGSTKTAWRLIKSTGEIAEITTSGINPFFRNTDNIIEDLTVNLLSETGDDISNIWFYGTGIVNNEKADVIGKALKKLYSNAKITVENDLLGACRALFGNNAGIACIMGTGSNAALFDGEKVKTNVPPLGFILGDEGSGAYLGKNLLGDLFKNVMPENLRNLFLNKYQLTKDEVLNRVYREPKPNHFLASFTPFLAENIDNEYCNKLVKRSFEAFIERNILKTDNYDCYKIGFVGSIAWFFNEILIESLHKYGIQDPLIIKEPIHKLVNYHIQF